MDNSLESVTHHLHDALQNEAASLGPQDEFDAEGNVVHGNPSQPITLRDWVIVMGWEDSTGQVFLTRTSSDGLAPHVENGMLHEALYTFD